LKRCLDKSPKRRWQAVGDLRAEIEALQASPYATALVGGASAAMHVPFWRRAIPGVAIALVVAAITSAGWWYSRPVAKPSTVTRFSVHIPVAPAAFARTSAAVLAISPDGTEVVYAGD